MERSAGQEGAVLSFLDQVPALVARAWARPLEGCMIRLRLAVCGYLPPAWCDSITAVHFWAGDQSVKYRVKGYEPNGSMIAFELEPASAEDAAKAGEIVEKRREYFTNIERIELEMIGGRRVEFPNSFFLPKT